MPTDDISEAQKLLLPLIQQSARGDHKAFSTLYKKTADRLYAVALRLLRRPHLAEEVMQETYVKIWHNASEYNVARGNVFTWMVTILRYRAIDKLRASKKDSLHDNIDDLPQEIHDNKNPIFDLEAAKDTAMLQGCMDELGDQQRHSIALAFFDGLTHEQLSIQLHAPLGTVKSWIRRGLLLLRRCLNNELQQSGTH